MTYKVEQVFRTEGVPEFTFVRPPNYNEILVDIRTPGKPAVIEGQSGTGKTTAVRKIIDDALQAVGFEFLSARKKKDLPRILEIADGTLSGHFIVDDFHRLENDVQAKIANLIKIAAEEYDESSHPKVVIVGINKVGNELIQLVHDIAKRCGIHRIHPAGFPAIVQLIQQGEERLNIKFDDHEAIFAETKGDYWLTQLICQSICLANSVTETQSNMTLLTVDLGTVRQKVIQRLESAYQETIKEFCRGKRFRSTNDPYLKLLRCVGEQDSSIVDLTELANANEDVRGSINNIKETRLSILIESKPICSQHFHYNSSTKLFAVEDPALFYYLKHLNWEDIRKACGFRIDPKGFDFDFAISFAGENRDLARSIANQLEAFDCSVFFDEFFEANYLGKAWHKEFASVFGAKSRFVICLLDEHYVEKIWPTFERESFLPRVGEESVFPIFLDDTVVLGIPKDIAGVNFKGYRSFGGLLQNRITDDIVFKFLERLDGI